MNSRSVFGWYWNRMRCMSAAEMVHRSARALKVRIEKARLDVANPVPRPVLSMAGGRFVHGGTGIAPDPYIVAAHAILEGRLRIFAINYATGPIMRWNRDPKSGRDAPLIFGKMLDYRNESIVGDIKYLWESNRHLHLVTLSQAWYLSHEQRILTGLGRLLESWLDQCPYPMGPNWTSSLELAIRLINWSIVWQLIGGHASPLFAGNDGRRLHDRWLDSIYQHMYFIRSNLSQYSSANNHLIGELAGLLIACVTWPFWPVTDEWRREAHAGLQREALLQNAPDGVNREQAISYQQFVLDFLLLAGLAGRANGSDFSAAYWRRIEAMLEYLASVMDAGGNVPMIGDSDDGYVVRLSQEADFRPYRSLLASGSVFFSRPDFMAKAGMLDDKTRWLFDVQAGTPFGESRPDVVGLLPRRRFPEGGYYLLGCEFETAREIRAVVDAGPLGYLSIAAHGHADALAMTLSVGGREFLIDPGTYAYHTQKIWRDYFRGTAAHNTVCVDGENQSVIGGNFMWLRKANARCDKWETNDATDRLVASHDGYLRLADPITHRREISLDKGARRFVIVDTLECRGKHRACWSWHFSEKCQVKLEDNVVVAANDRRTVRLRLVNADARFELCRGDTNPPCGWVSRAFDSKVETTTARLVRDIDGTTTIVTEIQCDYGIGEETDAH